MTTRKDWRAALGENRCKHDIMLPDGSGAQCQRSVDGDSPFCWQHTPDIEAPSPIARKAHLPVAADEPRDLRLKHCRAERDFLHVQDMKLRTALGRLIGAIEALAIEKTHGVPVNWLAIDASQDMARQVLRESEVEVYVKPTSSEAQ